MKNTTKASTTPQPNARGAEIIITPFQQGRIQVMLLGETPFVCNRQSEKTKRELLFPAVRVKNDQRPMKHNPLEEYQLSPYLDDNPESPTYIQMKGGAFKSAACDSAVDTPDVQAAQVRRLVSVPDFYVSMYGIPQMWMTDVRMAGISRTPDIRTRAIIPAWCALVTFTFVEPLVNQQKLLKLIANGGITRGVGDGRTEKGALDFGQYTIVNADDPRALAIMQTGGRAAQVAAMGDPQAYDRETTELFTWFQEEFERRKQKGQTTSKNGSKKMPEELAAALAN